MKPHYSTLTWPEFSRVLKKNFMSFDIEVQLFKEFHSHKQGPTTMKEYADKMLELSTKMMVEESEANQVMRFVSGLNYSIQQEMELLELPTLDRAYQVALKVKSWLKHGKDSSKGSQMQKNTFAKGGGFGGSSGSGE